MISSSRPFLVLHAELLSPPPPIATRYDCARAVMQVMVDGSWIDALDASIEAGPLTGKSGGISRETTDEQ